MLNVKSNPSSDTSIVSFQYHAYNPYTTSYNNNDEIRIAIQQQDLYVLIQESHIYIAGTVTRRASATATEVDPNWSNNHAFFLFDDIRYELNGIEVDRSKNVGITSTIKGYLSIPRKQMESIKTTSFNKTGRVTTHFSYCIPLKHVLGFAEDYKKVILNMKHELILTRRRNDIHCFLGNHDTYDITIDKINWRVPHVKVDDYGKLQLLKYIDENKFIHMKFRSWELIEYPHLPETNRHTWAVKSSNNINKPRYVIFAMQTGRVNAINQDSSGFDHCNVTNIKLYLNSECYPYENIHTVFGQNQTAILYNMYSKFQESYHHDRTELSDPFLTPSELTIGKPLFVFDCSRQNESVKSSVVDIRLEFETSENIPSNTRAYCLILHDNMVSYNPYTSIVSKNV